MRSCGTRWCYGCQKKEVDIEGGFYQHNQFSINDDDDEKCPLYLKCKYGSGPEIRAFGSHITRSGDAEEALNNFHEELLRKAMQDLKAELNNPVIWAKLRGEFGI
jgi:hypothetical protein